MSGAIEQILAMCLAEGGAYDASLHEKNPTDYVMTQPMSDPVRVAGENNAALSYAQTLGQENPMEGFIDEANETTVMFPFPPGVVEAALAAQRGMSWFTIAAIVAAAVGGAVLVRQLLDGRFDSFHVVVGMVFLLAAVPLFLRGRRRNPADVRR